MYDFEFPSDQATCRQFKIGLSALQMPVAEHGLIASAIAIVQFDEALPTHAASTNLRVFQAAERVFRQRRHLEREDIEIKESRLVQADSHEICQGTPDGAGEGVKVWLCAA